MTFRQESLQASFDRMLADAHEFAREHNSNAVLFMGNPTDPIPRALIQDRDLTPWARLIWCYFRQQSDSPAKTGAISDYDTIRELLGIGSRSTVADALHALRVTRWITLSAQRSDDSGRHHNCKVYLLHSLPPSYAQVMELDPTYAERLDAATRSPSKGIRRLARRMLDGAMLAADAEHSNNIYQMAAHGPHGRSAIWQSLYHRSPDAAIEESEPMHRASVNGALNFHESLLELSPHKVKLIEVKLRQVEEEYRQAYLDELAVRYLEGIDGGNVLKDPIAYLMWQVNQHLQGEVTLTGKADRLEALLARQEQKTRDRHQVEISNLGAELAHINRFIEHETTQGKEPEAWMLDEQHQIENEMSKLRREQNGA